MTKQPNSKANGALSAETTERHQGMQSSSAVLTPLAKSPPISAMSDSTALPNLNFQATPNSQNLPPNVVWGKIVQTFANKLVALGALEWRSLELVDGRKGWALFFPDAKWKVDPITKELTPTNAEGKK